MKLRKLNDLILECGEVKRYKPGNLASILEDRLADLFVHGTIDSIEELIELVVNDVRADNARGGAIPYMNEKSLREYASPCCL